MYLKCPVSFLIIVYITEIQKLDKYQFHLHRGYPIMQGLIGAIP
jgi:hypothetical protein